MDGTRGNKENFLSEILSKLEFPAFAGTDHYPKTPKPREKMNKNNELMINDYDKYEEEGQRQVENVEKATSSLQACGL